MSDDSQLKPPEGWVSEGGNSTLEIREPSDPTGPNAPDSEWMHESRPAERNPATDFYTGAVIGAGSKVVNPITTKVLGKVADVVAGPHPANLKPSIYRPQPGVNPVTNWVKSQHIVSDYSPAAGASHYKDAHQKMIAAEEARKKAEALQKAENLFKTEEQIRKAATPVADTVRTVSNVMTPTGDSMLGKAASLGAHTVGRAIAGGSAAYQGVDAYNRLQRGDYPGAIIGGIGALGSGLAMIPTPVTRVVGTGLGFGGELGTMLLDKYRESQQPEYTPQTIAIPIPEQKAQGGLIHLAGGGTPEVNFSANTMPSMTGRPGVGYMNTPPSAMARMQLEQELANQARLRAGVTGMGMALPGQQGVKLMPGNVDAGVNIPVGQGNVDISGYRSINPVNMPAQRGGHMHGANVRYTLPFAEGGQIEGGFDASIPVNSPEYEEAARKARENAYLRKAIEEGKEINANRNKYEPNKGSDKPVTTSRVGGGGVGFVPGSKNPFNPDNPLNR